MHTQKILNRQITEAAGVLGDHSHRFPGRIPYIILGGNFSVHQDLPPGNGIPIREDLYIIDERTLSGSGGTDNRDSVSGFYRYLRE